MRHLRICNFGPLLEAELDIDRLNVIVGPQSSGKSSVLKVAAYCAWLEKRIELTQSLSEATWDNIEEHLISFFSLQGYFGSSTLIDYETDCLHFHCEYKNVWAEWKDGRFGYKRSKIAYIPAERNIVSVVSNWQKIQAASNVVEFMTEWDIARQSRSRALKILNLGVQYSYDKSGNIDKIQLDNGVQLELGSASSGLQSLIPLYVNLSYLDKGQYRERYKKENYLSRSENTKLFNLLLEKYSQGELPPKAVKDIENGSLGSRGELSFEEELRRSRLYSNFVSVKNSQVYLEEPEGNLFPPEQVLLTEWLIRIGKDPFRKNVMFIATHSPYIVNCFLERGKKDFNLLITVPVGNGRSTVKNIGEEEIQKMYDSGVDVFFNFESFV